MTKISIITQNFSSPDGFSDTPLMLLPQAPPPTLTLSDRDQEGFNQLLLHDRNRQRQTYVQSYTAFETLRKRQDFVLRQESLRSLQNFVEHMATKQDQNIDQSFHSYKQCFGKFINIKSSTHRNLLEQQKRPKTAGASFNQPHMHQLSQIPATPLDPPAMMPFHRYQKSRRPSTSTRYRSNASSFLSAKVRHDPSRTTTFISHSQPFFSFTENYFQKQNDSPSSKSSISRSNYNDRTSSKSPMGRNNNNDRTSSKSPIPRSNYNDRISSKSPISRNNNNDQPSSKSQIIRSNNEDQSSNKVPIATNNDDDLPSNTFEIATNNDEDDRLGDEFQVEANTAGDRTSSKSQIDTHNDSMNRIDEQAVEYIQTTSTVVNLPINQKVRPSRTQHTRVNVSPRVTNTPSTTPQMDYNDAVRDGLILAKGKAKK
jgi:hypothetical protein